MAKVDDKKFGPKYPGLAADVVASDSTVMTVRQFIDDTVRGRQTRLLEFRNAPGYYLYLTQEEIQILCRNVSDDDDHWIGAEVPLVKLMVNSKRQGKDVAVWRIAGASADSKGPIQWAVWAEVMDAYTKATKGNGNKSAQSARRSGR